MKGERQQQSLCGSGPALQRAHELLVENALVGGVLIDENDPIFVLERNVGAAQLK